MGIQRERERKGADAHLPHDAREKHVRCRSWKPVSQVTANDRAKNRPVTNAGTKEVRKHEGKMNMVFLIQQTTWRCRGSGGGVYSMVAARTTGEHIVRS